MIPPPGHTRSDDALALVARMPVAARKPVPLRAVHEARCQWADVLPDQRDLSARRVTAWVPSDRGQNLRG